MRSTASRSAAAVDDAPARQPVERRERQVVAHRHRQHQALGLAILGDQRHADRPCAWRRSGRAIVDRRCRRSTPRRSCRAARRTARAAARAGPARRGRRGRPPRRRAAERHVAEPVGPVEPARLEKRRRVARRARRARRERGARPRVRSSARRSRRRTWSRPGSSRRCGRCGTRCTRRPARRSRASGARCRRARAPRRAAASAPRRSCVTSAAVSADVASSRIRMRGLRASAFAISTICRRDSDRSLTTRRRMDVVGAGARERFLGNAALRAPVDQPEAARRIADRDVVGDRQVRDQRQLLEDAGDAGGLRVGGRRERDRRAVEQHAALVGRDDAGHDLDQRRLAGAVLAEHRVDAAGAGPSRCGVLRARGRRRSASRRPRSRTAASRDARRRARGTRVTSRSLRSAP